MKKYLKIDSYRAHAVKFGIILPEFSTKEFFLFESNTVDVTFTDEDNLISSS